MRQGKLNEFSNSVAKPENLFPESLEELRKRALKRFPAQRGRADVILESVLSPEQLKEYLRSVKK